ncbi:putative membrane protein [Nocardioides aquaticus]|uniref:Membrane protein n=1 Tax=Nocardioides aquaticus TaxID=160826 RepID=A0ABX8EEY5_9ACTN|nr:DUF4350 domain-containing protein [Nocardioides aquaticus]QVT78652.1 putative membrane protein [Nocardioides aquaticus]
MSAVQGTATGASPGATPGPGTTRSWWRRRRGTVLLALVVLLLLAVVVALSGDPETTTPLDPDNPGREGTAALVEVLAEQGVEVEVVRDAAALEAAEVTTTTTVVVSSTDDLGRSTVERLREHARPGLLVLLEPGPAASGALGTPPGISVPGGGPVPAACSAPGAAGSTGDRLDDLSLEVDAATAFPGPGCFPDGSGGHLLVGDDGEVVLGAAQALTNEQVLRADNAALALRLLGGGDRLVWYVPDLTDLAPGDAVSVRSLLPPWLLPGLVLGLVAMLAVALWRGRRLGPLSVEALPVVVRAVETTRSRGRLYRSAGDRPHAATALRAAARARLAERLGLGAAGGGADRVEPLVRAVATATGQDAGRVAALLDPDAPTPTTDHDLITLAQDLDRLDREVRHP